MLINQYSNLSINKQVQMAAPVVNYMIISFEVDINPGYPQGIKLYLQAKKEIYKEADKLDIPASNYKGIMDRSLSLANKYGRERLAFMVGTAAVENNIFRQVDKIKIADMHHQAHGYFRLLVIRNFGNKFPPRPLVVSTL